MDGTRFGRYLLEELLGEGGMGQVYRAHDTGTDRRVAVKLLHRHIAADPLFRERFRREARAAAGLGDPHVIPIFDHGEIDGRLFICMQFVTGVGLDVLLARSGPLPLPRAVSVVGQVGSALDAAHAAGLVHRDVKPSNILVTERDFVYLIDFGIARAAGETGLTSTGATIGTFAYMAPERFTTGEADARTDVYALACVLHECLTGRTPYPTGSLEQQIAAHLTAPPPRPSTVRPGLGPVLDAVVARGLSKHPDDRYPTATALAAACTAATADTVRSEAKDTATLLDSVVGRTASAEPTPVRRRIPRTALYLVAVVAAVVAAGVGYRTLAPASRTLATPLATIVPVGRGPDAVAVDAHTHTAYVADESDDTVSVIDATTRRVTDTVAVGHNPVALAIDETRHALYVADYDDGTVSVIDTGTRKVTTGIPVGTGPDAIVVDPATHLVYVADYTDDAISVIDAGTRTVSATIPGGRHAAAMAIDPGTHTLYVAAKDDDTVSVIDIETHTATVIPVAHGPAAVAVDPGTHAVYVATKGDNSLSVVDAATHRVVTKIRVGGGPTALAVDPTAHTVYIADEGSHDTAGETVSVFDATTLVVTTRKVGHSPDAVAVDPATHTVLVADYDDNAISVLGPPS